MTAAPSREDVELATAWVEKVNMIELIYNAAPLAALISRVRLDEREACAVAVSTKSGWYRDEGGEKAAEIIRSRATDKDGGTHE